MRRRVFISYSRRQSTLAERLARDLQDAGMDVWIDVRQIEGGERWADEIMKGLRKSDVIVACLSPTFLDSEWCRKEINSGREQGKDIVPIMLIECFEQLDDRAETAWLKDIQFLKFENRYELGLADLVQALTPAPDPYDDIDEASIPNPFKGLEAFQQTDAHLFFGREELIAKLLDKLSPTRPTRFVAVVGASGTGKSSLVRAGVIPALRAGRLPGSERYPIVIVTPGANPLDALASRLLPLMFADAPEDLPPIEEVVGTLERNAQALHLMTERILGNMATPAERLVLIVDQFEEVFTRASEEERTRFIALIVAAATAANGHTQVMLTMRSDFFGGLSAHRALAELFENENLVIVTEMSAANLRRSIEGPAQVVGLTYDDGLIEALVDAVRDQAGSLPLLQYALKELYERREGRRLTMQAYREIGGVQRALAQHAEGIYRELPHAQQDVMRRVLLQLVEVNEKGEPTRRRVLRSDLVFRGVSQESVQSIIDLLTAPESRLLVANREVRLGEVEDGEAKTWLEVGHEALFREWERFKRWVAEDLENLRFGSEINQVAQNWGRANRDPAYLLTGSRLVRAEDWLENSDVSPLQREFVQTSIEVREQREVTEREQAERELSRQRQTTQRLRVLAGGLGIATLGVIILLGISINIQLTAQRREAEARSLAMAAAANQVVRDNDLDLGVVLAVEANRLTDPPAQAQRALAEVAYLPGTRLVLTGTQDAPAHTGPITAMAVSADGRFAVTGGEDSLLVVWEILGTDGTVVGRRLARTETNAASLTALAISRDGTRVLSAFADRTVALWSLAPDGTLSEVGRTSETGGDIRSVAFNPDGQTAAYGSSTGLITIRRVDTGEVIASLVGHTGAVRSMAYSADGLRLVSGAQRDLTPLVWDLTTSTALPRLDAGLFGGHTESINAVAISPDGTQVLSGAADNTAILWDLTDSKLLRRLGSSDTGHTRAVLSVAFSPDGSQTITGGGDNLLILWNNDSGQPVSQLFGHTNTIEAVAFLPLEDTAERVVLSASSDGALRVWDAAGSDVTERLRPHETQIKALDVSPDGTLVATGGRDRSVVISRLATGERLHVLSGHTGDVNAIAFTPDGTRLLSGSADGTVLVWDVATGAELLRLTGHSDDVLTLDVNATQAVTGGADDVLIVWDLAAGTEIRRIPTDTPSAVAFSPDGEQIASGDSGGRLILWDAATGAEVRRFGASGVAHPRGINDVDFSPDGTLLASASADFTLHLWNVETGASVRQFIGHSKSAAAVHFSADGRTLLSGGLDNTLRLWDVESGIEIRRYGSPIERTFAPIFAAAFVPGVNAEQAQTAVSGDRDGLVVQWRVFTEPTDLIDWAQANRYLRPLTCTERIQFRVEPLCAAG